MSHRNELEESEFVGHESCPSCGSRNNLARYSDGHAYCFSHGCGYYEPSDGEGRTINEGSRKVSGLIPGEYQALTARRLSEETCHKWGYQVGRMAERPVQIANYVTDGVIVAQKVRFPDKSFTWTGEAKRVGLYGQHLWRDGGRMVVVTEGEIDALSVSQLQDNKWPVVSVPNGAPAAAKAVRKELEWLEQFETVVFMFDMDEPGKEAASECAALLSPGKAKIASLPLKDANDMLKAGRGKEVIDAIWGAKSYRPDGLVSVDELMDSLTQPIEKGLPWCFDTLTKQTYGRRYGELYALGAGTGVGKTDVITQQIAYDISVLGQSVGVIFLEQKPTETAKRIAGKIIGKRLHVPDAGWTEDELQGAVMQLKGKVTFYDNFGQTDWDVVKGKIRYMAVSLETKLIYLDHLTALADTANEKESLEQLMKEMAALANELGIIIHFVSHLATPEGKPHEEGGRVMIRHFKGSRAIGFWSYYMFGLERNQQAEDHEERQTTTFRILKDRFTGQSTGEVFKLRYDPETGLLHEVDDLSTEFDQVNPNTDF